MHEMLHQAANSAVAMGPSILLQGTQIRRPIDVVEAAALTADDKRTILASWASDFYAIDSKPTLRHIPETPEPVSIDEIQAALGELDRRYGFRRPSAVQPANWISATNSGLTQMMLRSFFGEPIPVRATWRFPVLGEVVPTVYVPSSNPACIDEVVPLTTPTKKERNLPPVGIGYALPA